MRRLRLPARHPFFALLVLIAAVAVGRAVAAGGFRVPWIVPDELIYATLGESLWGDGSLAVRANPTPYYTALLPAVTGWPFAVFEVGRAVAATQALNAVLISLTALPVYLWTRSLATPRAAVAAAALALASPGFVYSGLVMSEALFVPLVVTALWAMARMLERPSALSAGLFLLLVTVTSAVRLQALALIGAALVAACAFSMSTRSTAVLRRLALASAGATLVLAVVVGALVAAGEPLSWTRFLGAYSAVGEERTVQVSAVASLAWHVAALAFATLMVPVMALAALSWDVFRSRARADGATAFVVVALAWSATLLVQSAFFAAAYTGNVAERYLISSEPLLAMACGLWCWRRFPARRAAVVAGVAVVVLAAAIPLETIAGRASFVANPFAAPLVDLLDADPAWPARAVLLASAVVALAAAALAPRRRPLWLPAALALALFAVSAASYREAHAASRAEWEHTVGQGDYRWIDHAAEGEPVLLLVNEERAWTGAARLSFWNRTVRRTLLLTPALRSVLPGTRATVRSDGLVGDATGSSVRGGLVVAPSTLRLRGELVALAPGQGSETSPWRLWRVEEPIRVALTVESGVDGVGDLAGPVRLVVPACTAGALVITFIGKTETRVTGYVNGQRSGVVDLVPGETPTVAFPTPPYVDGSSPCTYVLDVPSLTGSTRLEFVAGAP